MLIYVSLCFQESADICVPLFPIICQYMCPSVSNNLLIIVSLCFYICRFVLLACTSGGCLVSSTYGPYKTASSKSNITISRARKSGLVVTKHSTG